MKAPAVKKSDGEGPYHAHEVSVHGPWTSPYGRYSVEWEPDEFDSDEDDGAPREEWFETLDEAIARLRELLRD